MLLAVGLGHFDRPLAAAPTATAPALEMLVGIQAHPEQSLNLAAFQRLVAFEGLDHLRLVLAPVLRLHALRHIREDIIAQGALETAEPPPAPALGLLGQVQVTGDAHDDSQDQAQAHRKDRNHRVGAAIAHAAQEPLEVKDLLGVLEKLSEPVHRAWRRSPRRSSSALICESSSTPSIN
jgi:hypothetical protein